MRVPRIWERVFEEGTTKQGHTVHAFGWGWSESSIDEAREKATASARRVIHWLVSSGQSSLPDQYGYDERLPREEIIDEYQDNAGEIHGYVSRNAYGALILNTRDLMFIDIDMPPKPKAKANPLSLLSSLFGSKPVKSLDVAEPADILMDEIKTTASQHPDLGFRVYRTYNGFRLMVTNQKLLPDSDRSQQLLEQFKSDPLYVRMCKNQQCFRARLTPKAWRCNLKMPTERYPFANAHSESQYRKWEQTYSEGTRDYSTCNLLQTFGPNQIHPDIEGLVSIHDLLTKSASTDPLA